ncbi:SDR family oxidoreductase [Longimicrobium sp.]|uniref:SDR family oxidoreductase n=1 Tax=Longimicrobium sp. TaxID=2029185 RepID=UPI003B3AEACB
MDVNDGVVVTGASGLLGATVTLLARERGMRVTALYGTHPFHAEGVDARRLELADEGAVAGLLDEVRPRWVVHCAAATGVDWCETHPDEALRINADASGALARAAAGAGAQVAYVSTDSVFDGERGGYTEDDAPAPLNAYAHSKLMGEVRVREALPGALLLRTNLYGWNAQPKQSLAEWVLARLEAGAPFPGFTDLVFAPLLTNDLAAIILEMLERGMAGTWHLAAADAYSKYDFARAVAEVFGHDPALVTPTRSDDGGLRARRPRNTSLDAGRAAAALGRPMPSVREGLERFRALREGGYVNLLKACTGQ